MAKVVAISGTIKLDDGSTSEFIITPEGGWSQWGASQPRLGKTVEVMEAISEALFVDGLMEEAAQQEEGV